MKWINFLDKIPDEAGEYFVKIHLISTGEVHKKVKKIYGEGVESIEIKKGKPYAVCLSDTYLPVVSYNVFWLDESRKSKIEEILQDESL